METIYWNIHISKANKNYANRILSHLELRKFIGIYTYRTKANKNYANRILSHLEWRQFIGIYTYQKQMKLYQSNLKSPGMETIHWNIHISKIRLYKSNLKSPGIETIHGNIYVPNTDNNYTNRILSHLEWRQFIGIYTYQKQIKTMRIES